MSIGIKVAGGTGTGSRRPKQPPRASWTCFVCAHENLGYHATCQGCNAKRPA